MSGKIKTCGVCSGQFSCNANEANGKCWCEDLPPLPPVPGHDCLCPKCLAKAVECRGPRVEVGNASAHSRLSTPGSRPPAAFTLVELLVVIAVIAILAGLLLPTLGRSKNSAQKIKCTSNLRQLALATQMYWDDSRGNCFRYIFGSTNYGQIYWFGWLGPGAEGTRPFDAKQGALFPYLQGRGVEICPSLNYSISQFKLKAAGAAYGYGYNVQIAPNQQSFNISKVSNPARLVLMADAAQVNTFQAPASPANPMLEEFYYISTNLSEATTHFRHAKKANASFCDGHVALEKPFGPLDERIAGQILGRLNSNNLIP